MSQRSGVLWVFAHVLFALNTIPCHGTAQEPFILVSDVDDTVKITNVPDHEATIRNTIHSKLVFAGTAELYTQMLGSDSLPRRLRFLSAGFLTTRTAALLSHSGFPAHELTLREFSTHEDLRRVISSISSFKTDQLQQLYGTSADNVILIGDDTQSDPAVYTAFAAKHRGRVLAVYIHRITGHTLPPACRAGRALPAGCISFITAYDIALHELLAGRLGEREANAVGKAVLNSDTRTLLPDFQECPSQFTAILNQPESLATLESKINAKLTELCNKRKTGVSTSH